VITGVSNGALEPVSHLIAAASEPSPPAGSGSVCHTPSPLLSSIGIWYESPITIPITAAAKLKASAKLRPTASLLNIRYGKNILPKIHEDKDESVEVAIIRPDSDNSSINDPDFGAL